MTSHYNVWWNGNQSVKEGEKALRESIKDDYTTILPMYNYGTKENAMALNSQMDRAIEKASISIQRHSMYFNGREYVKSHFDWDVIVEKYKEFFAEITGE